MIDQAQFRERRKSLGAYYTPDGVVQSLVRWAVRHSRDRLLDPACGDGRFLVIHPNSVGVEHDPSASAAVHERAPGSLIHEGDFFTWASKTHERFQCAAGNPPFIRYQRFNGAIRRTALELCARHGASFSGLSSSWAPFIVATAGLLRPGGRMAFVVPAEIGHAPYARPALEYLVSHFDCVQLVAVRHKLFADLSEDCWLLYVDGYGGETDHILLSVVDRFDFMPTPPSRATRIELSAWRRWGCRVRPFLLRKPVREFYRRVADYSRTKRLGDVARVGIGYVTGANGFFHLRPSEAAFARIPRRFLALSVRNAKALSGKNVCKRTIEAWVRRDDPVLLLRIAKGDELPRSVVEYLDSAGGHKAQRTYKCRMRDPWYVVPDVKTPDAFLTYMSSKEPILARNSAACVCTNSIHAVALAGTMSITRLQRVWDTPFTALSCEIEGHALGGGMLKLEPREAARVVLADSETQARQNADIIEEGVRTLRRWRHRAD